MSVSNPSQEQPSELDVALASLRRDYSKLAPRIRALDHSVTCECDGVSLRVHFPALRQGQATIQELVDVLVHFLNAFALPRTDVKAVDDLYGKVDIEEFKVQYSKLSDSARALFKRASKATNHNGEAGELLLYLLTEWILDAPQLIAKMSLKTNSQMPVHGSDGVHVKYFPEQSRLIFYWGESKLYADVDAAITAAVTSITDALKPEKMQHELDLVQRNIDSAGLDPAAKDAILRYLDPYDEAYNERHDVTTCLIGFNFAAFGEVASGQPADAEAKFAALALAKLEELGPQVATALKAAGMAAKPIEIFFLPVPSVQALRDVFQAKIGWNT